MNCAFGIILDRVTPASQPASRSAVGRQWPMSKLSFLCFLFPLSQPQEWWWSMLAKFLAYILPPRSVPPRSGCFLCFRLITKRYTRLTLWGDGWWVARGAGRCLLRTGATAGAPFLRLFACSSVWCH